MLQRTELFKRIGVALVFLALFSLLSWQVLTTLRYELHWSAVWQDRGLLLRGWGATCLISMAALLLGCALGLILAIGQRSAEPSFRFVCRTYVELVRGTPFLVQLLIGFYVLAPAFHIDHKPTAAIILLACFESAYLAEILRGGVESIEKTQWDASRALGFTNGQTWRFVILPQALRRVLPGLTGQAASLIKDSSLLMVIGVQEFAFQSEQTARNHAAPLEAYLPMAVGYLALTLPLSWASRWLERRWAGS